MSGVHKDDINDYQSLIDSTLAFATSPAELKGKLSFIVKTVADTLNTGTSLILLDSSHKNLIHHTSFKLPKYYLQKGLIDPRQSLDEIQSGQPVIINNIDSQSHLQYSELALQARITSIAGFPIVFDDNVIGSLRIYQRSGKTFSQDMLNFARQIASIISLLLANYGNVQSIESGSIAVPGKITMNKVSDVCFAHPSEAEFAQLLDYYNIEWAYEPRAFVLERDGNRITSMFSPDFYLPGLDLYVEITTLKQSLATYKNRKIRQLKTLYPDIKITLLNKNNYDRLLAKYGVGLLGQSRAHGIKQVLFSADQLSAKVTQLAASISTDYKDKRPVLLGIQRGFICFMADLIRQIDIPLDIDFMAVSRYAGKPRGVIRITKDIDLVLVNRHVLVVEDIIDTGMTLSAILNLLKGRNPASLEVCALLDRRARRIVDIQIKYAGFDIPDEFVVGYGLDYKEEYRNLPFIGVPDIRDSL